MNNFKFIDGGSHWTLLIFHKDNWWYVDSSSATVPSYVRKLAENTSKLMGKKSISGPKVCPYTP